MDLAAFLAETIETIRPVSDGFPGFPVREMPNGNGQTSEEKEISRTSRISRTETPEPCSDLEQKLSADMQMEDRGRARGYLSNRREIREQREVLAGSDTCISRSSFKKREIEKKTGNLTLLPAIDGLDLWRAALFRTDDELPPCPGYRFGEWPLVRARALAFLDRFGAQAEALGWTGPRLFGVHPVVGIVRVDTCGALMLPVSGTARAITATEIAFATLTHREKLGQPEGVPFWKLTRCNPAEISAPDPMSVLGADGTATV